MSSKTRTRKNRTTKTGSTPALRPVGDQTATATARTEAEDKLWEALRAHPNSTAPVLAGAANIGRSTAGKILTKWAKDGSVTRTPGIAQGGGRAADLWAITHTTASANDTTPNGTTPSDTAPEDAIREETSASNPDDPAATPIYATVPADSPSPGTETTAEPTDSGSAETANTESRNTEPPSAEPETADPVPDASDSAMTKPVIEPDVAEIALPAADSAAAEHAETDRAATGGTATGGDTASDGTVNGGTAANGDTVGKQPRLAPGALEGKVEDFLREHPDDEFGPAAIAKKLDRSSGAVSNALDRLVGKGTAVQTKASPKRYALAKGERTAAAATS